jgi:hypothetical protein
MFMRHFGQGVGHQQYGTWQEVEVEMGPVGNGDDTEEMDEDDLSMNVDDSDNASEGEEFASGSDDDNSDGGSNDLDSDGCNSDDLGYASF